MGLLDLGTYFSLQVIVKHTFLSPPMNNNNFALLIRHKRTFLMKKLVTQLGDKGIFYL